MVFGTCKRRRMFYVTDLSLVLKPKPRRKPTGVMLSGMMKGLVLYWAALVSFVPTRKQRANWLNWLEYGTDFGFLPEIAFYLNLGLCLLLGTLWLISRSR